ncbi:MAG: hypothetical protein IT454_09890 [Planctomycetes bacterium]|nr:hypothetical protein [Planctomycetota bacterium]
MNTRFLSFCAAGAICASASFAQGPFVAWQNSFAGAVGSSDWCKSIAVAPTGQAFVTGTTFEEESATSTVLVPRMLTRSIAPDGSTAWTRVFGLGFYSGNGVGTHVALQPTGRVVVGGAYDLGQDWVVVGYEANGALAWSGVWDANSWFSSEPADMAVDGAGNIYLCGDYGDPGLGMVGGVVKFGANGQLLWSRALDTTTELNSVHGLCVDAAGSVYLTGLLFDGVGSDRFTVVKLDSSGTRVWTRSSGSTALGASSVGVDVGLDGNGRVLAAGYGSGPSSSSPDVLAVAYDASGNTLWNASFDGGANQSESVESLAIDAQGRMFVAATTLVPPSDFDSLVVAFAADGSLAWSSHTPTPLDYEQPQTIATDGNGTALVAGLTISSTGWTGFARLHFQGGAALADFDFGPSDGRSFFQGSAAGPGRRWFVAGELANANSDSNALTVAIDDPTATSYCTAGTSALGCAALISASGVPRASATSGFVLTTSGLDAQRLGLVFYGISGRLAQAWGPTSSFLCVKPPTQRMPVQNSGGSVNTCSGTLTVDWSQFVAGSSALGTPFQAGDIVHAQAWYRDPPSAKSTALSNALDFVVQP